MKDIVESLDVFYFFIFFFSIQNFRNEERIRISRRYVVTYTYKHTHTHEHKFDDEVMDQCCIRDAPM